MIVYLERYSLYIFIWCKCFPGGSDGKRSICNMGDLGLIPGLEISPGEGNGYSLQYSGLENSMDRGAWRATVHGVAKSRTWLSNFHFYFSYDVKRKQAKKLKKTLPVAGGIGKEVYFYFISFPYTVIICNVFCINIVSTIKTF